VIACHICTLEADSPCPDCGLSVCEGCVEPMTVFNSGVASRCLACVDDAEDDRAKAACAADEAAARRAKWLAAKAAASRRRYYSPAAVEARAKARRDRAREARERSQRDAELLARLLLAFGSER